jgi:hypothetical protein
MLWLVALPVVLLALSFIVVDKDVRQCMRGVALIYTLDFSVGSVLFSSSDTFYLSAIITNLLILLATKILESPIKQILCSFVVMVLILLNLNEHLNEYQTVFYPYLNYINYWSGELLSIIITWNVKWKIYEYKNISN